MNYTSIPAASKEEVFAFAIILPKKSFDVPSKKLFNE